MDCTSLGGGEPMPVLLGPTITAISPYCFPHWAQFSPVQELGQHRLGPFREESFTASFQLLTQKPITPPNEGQTDRKADRGGP